MRLRSLLWLCLALPVFTTGAACSCDPSIAGPGVDAGVDMGADCPAPNARCPATMECVFAPADPSALCTYDVTGYNNGTCDPANVVFDTTTCTFSCSACTPPMSLKPGFMAQYLDSVAVNDGSGGEYVAISGYSPGWLDVGHVVWPYGDLVYAQFTPGGDEVVDYTILDGKPAEDMFTVQFNPTGWRGGVADPGENVGMYSTIAASTAGDVYIAYSDFTPGAFKLKLAHRAPGATTWAISTIDDSPLVTQGGAFFPSIAMLNGTTPVVAYGVREASLGAGQQPHGWIRIRTATSGTPSGSGDWSSYDETDTVAEIGCLNGDGLCATGDRCVTVGTTGRGECVTPTNDCTTPCAGMFGTEVICSETLCRNVRKGGDLVDTVGVGIDLQPVGTGLALAYHDRSAGAPQGTPCSTDTQCTPIAFCSGAIAGMANSGECMIPNGNLWGMRFDGTTWSDRFLIDGYSRKVATVGDCGQHVSLAVDGTGVWHLAYLDGTFERIRYAQVQTNNSVSQYAFIDDGTPGATRPADRLDGRRRLLGGDISIALSASGELRVLYQDLTGPTNPDPDAIPPGVQPVLAYRAASATAVTPWTVEYGGVGLSNAGWWVVQSMGITAGTNSTSYCVWADRTSNSNSSDPSEVPIEDGADTHVTTCRTSP